MPTDYKTRLTADTSQHDKAINKSAQQIYKYKKQTDTAKSTLAGLAKKFGPLAAQIGIAGGALGVLTKGLRSTEQGADALDRALYTAKSSVNKFFQGLSSGSFDAFLGGLSDIVSTAKEAYNALDALGTASMWKNARISQLNAMIAEDRVIVNNAKSSKEDRAAAQQRIDLNMQKIQALSGELVTATMNAATAKLREIAGTSKVSNSQLQKYLEMWENGTLSQHYNDYMAKHSYQSAYTVTPTEGAPYTMYETKYYSETDRILANAMRAIMTTNEKELQQYYTLLQQAANLQTTTANERLRADRMINKGDTSGTTNKTPEYQQGSIADIEHQINALRDRLKNEVVTPAVASDINAQIESLQNKKAALEMQLTFGVHGDTPAEVADNLVRMLDGYFEGQPAELPVEIDADTAVETWKGIEDAINAEWQKFVEEKKRDLEDLASVTNEWNTILAQTGSMFESIGQLGDENFAKVMGGIGDIVASLGSAMGTIGETIAKYNALALSKGLASASELPFPYNLGAIATVVASIMSVIGTVASVATQRFADGGIVQGKTTIGDYNYVRADAGELILNNRQQARLFHMLNNPTITTTTANGGNVTFTIHGSDLQGTLNNYNKKAGRVR